ncbi:hypothetical protein H4R35_000276 [Dimargaris xerosporica]|nr:hypothetical protein H4R35_000276 [Dimargaris xerosporica]
MAFKDQVAHTRRLVVQFAKERYPVDLPAAIYIVSLLACWGLSYYFMNVMANVASYRSSLVKNKELLPDLGFEVIPHVDALWLTDFFDALMFAPTAIMVALFNRRPNYIMAKGLTSSFICNVLRTFTIAITSLPDPRVGCEYVLDDFWGTFKLHRCGDCMFSGHTTIFVLCTMVWISHGPRNTLGIALTFCILAVCVAGSIIVVANRAHYTMDVFVAWYVAVGTWFTVSHFWDTQVVARGWLRTINFPDPKLYNNGKANHMITYAPLFSDNEKSNVLPMSSADLRPSSPVSH